MLSGVLIIAPPTSDTRGMELDKALKKVLNEMIERSIIIPGKESEAFWYLNIIGTVYYEAGVRVHSNRKPVIQFDQYGKKIERFESIAQAAKATKIDNTSIVNVCKSKQHSAGGYQWRYEKDL